MRMKDYSMQHKLNFSTFLVESKRLRFFDGPSDDVIEKIKTECSDIIELYKSRSKFIYRGEQVANKYGPNSIFIASIRDDRKPVEMDEKYHEEINSSMQRLALTAHRGNSIFCTTSTDDARSWGRVCVIFPKNGFKYTWFQNHNTEGYVFDDLNRGMRGVEQCYAAFQQVVVDSHNDATEAKEIVKRRNFGAAINHKFKDLFSMFGIDEDSRKLNSPETFREYLIDNMIIELEPFNKHLDRFLTRGGELLITGQEYYGVVLSILNAQTFSKLINDDSCPISKILK